MPTPPLLEPAKKVTLLLYEKDVATMKLMWGHGWTTYLREHIKDYLRKPKPGTSL